MVKDYYIDNKVLLHAIIGHKANIANAAINGTEKPRITPYLGECILKIAERLSYRPNFIGYTFKEEMISDGVENCIQYFDNFNPEKGSNPFAYFTQILFQAYQRRIQKEEKFRYTVYKNFQDTILIQTSDYDKNEFAENTDGAKFYENIDTFMANFEAKELRRKQKRELQKAENAKLKGK